MRTRWFVLLLLGSTAIGQATAPKAKPQQAPAQAPATLVAENAPVITIDGVCNSKTSDTDCKTVITRAQFDQLLAILGSRASSSPAQLSPAVKRNMADQYSRLLILANAAEKAGTANTPTAEILLKFARMQALAQAYSIELQQKLQPTDAEIKTYYDANASKLEEATVERIFVPKALGASGNKPDEAAVKAAAEKIRTRAVAGEAFDALQKEALGGRNVPAASNTKLVIQKGTLPVTQQSVFDLKPGEVSQVFLEPAGYFIFKLDSKGTTPIEQVKGEIQQRLLQEKMQAALESALKSATPSLNEAYFGAAPTPQTAPSLTPAPRH